MLTPDGVQQAQMLNDALSVWLQFGVSVLLIGLAGVKLTRYGDVIAEKTGMGGTWVGLILLATVTSLPELSTGVSAVTFEDSPDIAVGDVLGSCVFNLTLLVVLDFLHREESIYSLANQGHILSAAFAVVLIGFADFNILLGDRADHLAIGHVGLYTPLIVVIYALAVRSVFVYERKQRAEFVGTTAMRYPDVTLRQAVVRYAGASLIVVGAGIWLPFIGVELAQTMGWHKTFVGTLLIAFATSVPELIITIAAVRLGALDMAISNLLGSNLFDIFIIAMDDVLFTAGPILSHVSPLHAVTALSAMIMTGIAIIGLLYRPATRLLQSVGWVSLFLFSVYLLNSYVLYLYAE